jgi:hypothetical protein
MASQTELINFIKNKYKWSDTEFGALKFEFKITDDRSQLVFAWINETSIQVSSPFATTDKVTPLVALQAVSEKALGMQLMGDLYVACYYAPIADIDASEIEYALELTAFVADELEKQLVGTDNL